MTAYRWRQAAAVAALLAVSACSSKAERAAEAMAEAVQLNAAGQYRAAALKFDRAVQLRDDLPALWIARARNQVQMRNYGGAFRSYRNALDQDRTNREALDAVAQIALAISDLDNAEDYANQILALDPNDMNAQLVRTTVELRRGRLDSASDMVEKALAQDGTNEQARVLKSRILQRRGDAAGALALIAPIFDAGGGSPDLRQQLMSLYQRSADGNGLLRVAERNARDQPRDAASQIAYAKYLLLTRRFPQAATVLDRVHRIEASDATREQTLTMLTDADVPLADVDAMLATLPSPQTSLAIAAAEYGSSHGAGAAARRRLAGLVQAQPLSAGTTDLHAAYAYALVQTGQVADAARRATAVLAIDPDEPIALGARALAEIAGRDLDAALRDARVVARDNPNSASAVALLAQVYRAGGDPGSAASAITSGFNDNQDDAEFLALYVAQLVATGRATDAAMVARSFTIRQSASVLAWRLRAQLSAAAGDPAAAARARGLVARLHGQPVPLPPTPADEQMAQRDLRDDLNR